MAVCFLNGGETSFVVTVCKLDSLYNWQGGCPYSLHMGVVISIITWVPVHFVDSCCRNFLYGRGADSALCYIYFLFWRFKYTITTECFSLNMLTSFLIAGFSVTKNSGNGRFVGFCRIFAIFMALWACVSSSTLSRVISVDAGFWGLL